MATITTMTTASDTDPAARAAAAFAELPACQVIAAMLGDLTTLGSMPVDLPFRFALRAQFGRRWGNQDIPRWMSQYRYPLADLLGPDGGPRA